MITAPSTSDAFTATVASSEPASVDSALVAAAKQDLTTVRQMRSDFGQGVEDAADLTRARDVEGAIAAVQSAVGAAVSGLMQLHLRSCEEPRNSFPALYPVSCAGLNWFPSTSKCLDRFSRGMRSGNYELAELGLLDCDNIAKAMDAAIARLKVFAAG